MILAVISGAFGAHAIKSMVSASHIQTWQTASEYHIYHALGLVALGIWCERRLVQKFARLAGLLMIAGIILFSGSLYLLVLTGNTKLGMITPIGGVLFIGAWSSWLLAVMYSRPD